MATMNVSLPDPMKSWVEDQSKDGRYSNASDYIRDLIRKDRERAEGVGEIQELITLGMESGEPRILDKAALLMRVRQKFDTASNGA